MTNHSYYKISCLLCIAVFWTAMSVPTFATPPRQGNQTIHIVQPSETLFIIAQQYHTTVDAIVAANRLADPNQIQVGQQLIIPGHNAAAPTSVYIVQPGDTLALIARRSNTSIEQVAQLNRLANPNLIYVGQKLLIPLIESGAGVQPAGSQVYVTQPGDTLANIAARYGLAVWTIAQANNITNPNVIHAGQRLLIPGGQGQSSLPSPFRAITIIPPVAVQGQTVQVIVEIEEAVNSTAQVTLTGSYNDLPLLFVCDAVSSTAGGTCRTLIGIHAFARPGPYALRLDAVSVNSAAVNSTAANPTADGRQISVHSMLQVVQGNWGTQYLTFSDEKAALLDPALAAQESQTIWDVTNQATLPQRWTGPFNLPLAGNPAMTASFGIRRSYNGGPVDSFHSGIDYSASEGAPVYSPAPGQVVLAKALLVRGNVVIIDHGRGVMSGYWHLSQINVVEGQEVNTGDILGAVGNTGLSTGAHLHWEIRVMGVQVEPLQWLQENIW